MLLNRTFKRDKFVEDDVDRKYSNTATTNFKSTNGSDNNNSKQTQLSQYQLQLLNYKQSLTKGISHPRIKQMIMNHGNIQSLFPTSSPSPQKQSIKQHMTNLQLIQQRKWLTKKGKKYLIDFDDSERKQMKDCFNAMDIKKNGSIGIDELEELLISVGLMESREEVKQLIDSVDQDKSGKIEFSEFLKMILNDEGQNQEIVQFFKYIINNNRKRNQHQIEWGNKPKSKSRDHSKENHSVSPPKKISIVHDKQNLFQSSQSAQKSSFHQMRNKFFSSPQSLHQSQQPIHKNQNSALHIFQKHPHPKNLPFGMIVSHIRRKHMMTALKIGQNHHTPLLQSRKMPSTEQTKSNHYISSNVLRSSQNMKESKTSQNGKFSEEQVAKGQNVMNALRKMWDRRLLRQLREKKLKKQIGMKSTLTATVDKGKSTFPMYQHKNKMNNRSLLPNLMTM